MIPEKRSPILEIPITFDSVSKPQGLTNDKFYLSLLVFGVWLFLAIVSLFVDITISEKILFIIGSLCVALFIIRVLLMREKYFRNKREELKEKNFQYPYSVFWNIYEITSDYPTICRYANGLKAIFVVFDKDVIVGKEADAEYYHYEAISEAYLQMHKRGINCVHIDYMDTVGKDNRIDSLFDLADNTKNDDLKDVLLKIFDNVEDIMQHSYASYDVYAFFYSGKEELFMDELEVVLDEFLEANYIRYRILNKDGIGELVKSIFNIDEFSVRETSEKLFTDLGGTHYLKPIWVERETPNGVEKVVLGKTRGQIEAEKQTKNEEIRAKKNRRKRGKKNKHDDEVLENFDLQQDINNQYGNPNFNMNDNFGMNQSPYSSQVPYNDNISHQNLNQDFYDSGTFENNFDDEDSDVVSDFEMNMPMQNNQYDDSSMGIPPSDVKPQDGFADIMQNMSFNDIDIPTQDVVLDIKPDKNSLGVYDIEDDDDEDLEIL